MRSSAVSKPAVVLIAVLVVLAGSLIVLSSTDKMVLADAPQDAGVFTSGIDAQATPDVTTTAIFTGHINAHTEVHDTYGNEITLYRAAILTTTVSTNVSGAGHYELRSDLLPGATFDVTIEHGGETDTKAVTLSGQENIDDQIETTGTNFYFQSTDSPLLSGNLDVSAYSGRITITHGTENFSGNAPAYIYDRGIAEVFLPIVQKHGAPTPTPPPSGYYDDFSNPNSGWPTGDFGHCRYEYYYDHTHNNWYYRITAEDKERCVIPAPSWATQRNGTFEIMAARSGGADDPGMYGFFFNAGTDADRNRWGLEVRPDPVACGDEPFYWLSYINNGHNQLVNPGAESCTTDLYTGSSWNRLKTVMSNGTVSVYLNNQHQITRSPGGPFGSNYKYFDLEVIADSSRSVTVYFDWVRFTP